MRRRRWYAIALACVAGASALVCISHRPQPRVMLKEFPRELRILGVSLGREHVFSAEPGWKRASRALLPDRWETALGPFRGKRFTTSHESLVVWLDSVSPSGGLTVTIDSEQVKAVMPDGSLADGRNQRAGGNSMTVEFRSFDREARRIPIRVRDVTNLVTFHVDNPRPTRAARWPARKPPQTNVVAATEVALLGVLPGRRFGRNEELPEAVIHARALGDGRMGWTGWRVTVFDPWNNWTQGEWSFNHTTLRLPALLQDRLDWKLSFEAEEYLSAGFVPPPSNGVFTVLPPGQRARSLGVRFMMFAGPGAYRVSDGNVASVPEDVAAPPGRSVIWFSRPATPTNWILELRNSAPCILYLYHWPSPPWTLNARLRERMDGDSGRIFFPSGIASTGTTVDGVPMLATLRTPMLRGPTTNLEVELIAKLPPVEFFVVPPGR